MGQKGHERKCLKEAWADDSRSQRAIASDQITTSQIRSSGKVRKMEMRGDLQSILPFLPLIYRSSSLFWPPPVVEALKDISKGPHHSRIDSGESLFIAISDIRNSLSLSTDPLVPSAPDAYALYFDDVSNRLPLLPVLVSCVVTFLLSQLMLRSESAKWFSEVVPKMAELLLRLPALLESHYSEADSVVDGISTGLRILHQQNPGTVFLTQVLTFSLVFFSFFFFVNEAASLAG